MIRKINLGYPLDSLEPYYSRETLNIHYNTLYTGYVDNTNLTLDKLEKARKERNFENIKCLEKNLSFFCSGVILHELFFENMGPAIPSSPDINLMEQINKEFDVPYYIFEEIVDYIELTAHGKSKSMKWENIKKLLGLAKVNNRLTSEQVKFLINKYNRE